MKKIKIAVVAFVAASALAVGVVGVTPHIYGDGAHAVSSIYGD